MMMYVQLELIPQYSLNVTICLGLIDVALNPSFVRLPWVFTMDKSPHMMESPLAPMVHGLEFIASVPEFIIITRAFPAVQE